MEPQLFQQFKPVDDAATTAATANFRPAQFHRKDSAALKADIANLHLFPRQLFLGRGLDDRGAGLATEQQAGCVRLWVAADQQHTFAHFGHHVRQVGQREAFADATLAIDRDDLGFLGGFALRDFQRGFFRRFKPQARVEIL